MKLKFLFDWRQVILLSMLQGLVVVGFWGCAAPAAVSSGPGSFEARSAEASASAGMTPEALYLLGMDYAKGSGAAQDNARALALFEESLAGGEPRAGHALGWLYFSGRGVAQDYDKAFVLFKGAAEKGVPDAQHMLGLMYGNGWGVKKDGSVALYWTKKAADNGQPEAGVIVRDLQKKLGGNGK